MRLATVHSSLSCEQQNRVRVRLGRIDFEKKKKKFLRIDLKVGDEQIRLGRIDFEKKKKFGENEFEECVTVLLHNRFEEFEDLDLVLLQFCEKYLVTVN
ncbi:hypothetical protein QL285_074851 [Trifolium repens]|nr:hypothetical protein QL285_074851 [Trifolium repens]